MTMSFHWMPHFFWFKDHIFCFRKKQKKKQTKIINDVVLLIAIVPLMAKSDNGFRSDIGVVIIDRVLASVLPIMPRNGPRLLIVIVIWF